MTRPQDALRIPKPTITSLGLALLLGIVFAAQIPSAAEAFGARKSGGTFGGFGAGAGWNRGGPVMLPAQRGFGPFVNQQRSREEMKNLTIQGGRGSDRIGQAVGGLANEGGEQKAKIRGGQGSDTITNTVNGVRSPRGAYGLSLRR